MALTDNKATKLALIDTILFRKFRTSNSSFETLCALTKLQEELFPDLKKTLVFAQYLNLGGKDHPRHAFIATVGCATVVSNKDMAHALAGAILKFAEQATHTERLMRNR